MRNLILCLFTSLIIISGIIYLDKDIRSHHINNDEISPYQASVNHMKNKASYYNSRNNIQNGDFQLEHVDVNEQTKKIIYYTVALNFTSSLMNDFSTADIIAAKKADRERMIIVFKNDKDIKMLLSHGWRVESICKTKDGLNFEDETINQNDMT